jgi:DNA-binding response OmpR family regulator
MSGKTILLVQVDSEVRNYIDLALRSDGYRLIVANKASELGDLAREEHAKLSLVLLDLTFSAGTARPEASDKRCKTAQRPVYRSRLPRTS